MSKKYVIEIKSEYEDTIRGIMVLGAKDSNLYMDALAVEDMEELTSDYINEHYGSLKDDAYQRGLEDGKQPAVGAAELREKLEYQKGFKDGKAQSELGCEGCSFEGTEIYLRPCSACRNAYPNQWTAKDDKIVVGDEVVDKNGYKTIVTYIYGDLFDGLCSDGSTMTNLFLDDNHKTGRHFDVDKILDEMKGNNDK